MNAEEIIRQLGLKPHPEGGFYRETYRSPLMLPGTPARCVSTAIYYLLVPGAVSKLHRLKQDEVFHFHLGDPVEWVFLDPQGPRTTLLGADLSRGEILQMVVPAGTWFGGALREGGKFCLMGTTVAPGFDFQDFELGKRGELLEGYPSCRPEILRLT